MFTYLKCGNVIVSYNANIQLQRSDNLVNMLKIPVNGVPWSLPNKVPQVRKC